MLFFLEGQARVTGSTAGCWRFILGQAVWGWLQTGASDGPSPAGCSELLLWCVLCPLQPPACQELWRDSLVSHGVFVKHCAFPPGCSHGTQVPAPSVHTSDMLHPEDCGWGALPTRAVTSCTMCPRGCVRAQALPSGDAASQMIRSAFSSSCLSPQPWTQVS